MSNTLDEILRDRVKFIDDDEWVCRGTPSELITDIQALITEKVVKLANLYGEPRCENLHHAKKNQHTSIEDCPVEKAINAQLKEKL